MNLSPCQHIWKKYNISNLHKPQKHFNRNINISIDNIKSDLSEISQKGEITDNSTLKGAFRYVTSRKVV